MSFVNSGGGYNAEFGIKCVGCADGSEFYGFFIFKSIAEGDTTIPNSELQTPNFAFRIKITPYSAMTISQPE